MSFKDEIREIIKTSNAKYNSHKWQRFTGDLKSCNCDECLNVEVCLICKAVRKKYNAYGNEVIKNNYYFSLDDYEFIKNGLGRDEIISCDEVIMRNIIL
jgi:hypothetical protein